MLGNLEVNITFEMFSINAGCTALPALLNIKHVMQQRQVTGIWNGKDELPVSVFFRRIIVFLPLFNLI